MEAKNKWIPYVLTLPALLYVLGMIIYPLFQTLYYSLNRVSLGGASRFIAFGNFHYIINSSKFLTILQNTLMLTIVDIALCVGLGLTIALLIHEVTRGKRIYVVLFIIPIALSPLVVGWTWKFLFHSTVGLFNSWSVQLGLGEAFLGNPKTSLWMVTIADVWQWTPLMIFVILAGLESIPEKGYELAKLDGASKWSRFKNVTFPGIKGVLMIGVLIRFMDSIRIATKPLIMTGGGPGTSSETLSLYAYRHAFTYANVGTSSAISLLLLYITIITCFILFKKVFPW